MAKKSFFDKAQQAITESDTLPAEEMVETAGKGRGEYEGTLRLKEARNVPISKIKPDPNQPRKTFPEEPMKELTASVELHGVLEPITVEYVEEKDYFKIITGERRYRAAKRVGLADLPCMVRTVDDKKRLTHQLIENIQREDLGPVDKARGLLELKSTLGNKATWKDVEKITGISERRRQQFLALLDLPNELQYEIVALGRRPAKNRVTEKHARALLRLNKYPDKQLEFFNKIRDGKSPITGDQALELVKNILGSQTNPKQKISFTYTDVGDLIKQLQTKLRELKDRQKADTRT